MGARAALIGAGLALSVQTCALPLAAQTAIDPLANARYFPMVYVDEASMDTTEFPKVAFDEHDWQTAKACVAAHGIDTTGAEKPSLRVVPLAHSIRVTDLTVDSIVQLNGTPDSVRGRYQNKFMAPVVAYTFMHRNLVLAVRRAAADSFVRQHEALHALLWHAHTNPWVDSLYRAGDWHPIEIFGPCAPGFLAP